MFTTAVYYFEIYNNLHGQAMNLYGLHAERIHYISMKREAKNVSNHRHGRHPSELFPDEHHYIPSSALDFSSSCLDFSSSALEFSSSVLDFSNSDLEDSIFS